jgi:hypothetical protein
MRKLNSMCLWREVHDKLCALGSSRYPVGSPSGVVCPQFVKGGNVNSGVLLDTVDLGNVE